MHAGHTPLARDFEPLNLDGATSGRSSDTQTPTGPAPEQHSDEPHEIEIKPPSERHDSYFPSLSPPESIIDEDPALKGPLSLTNEATGDKMFLSELDTKLLHAAHASEVAIETPSESNGSETSNFDGQEKVDGGKEGEIAFEQPEQEEEPKLRIKRSMNFGSQLAGTGFGRGF